MPGPKSVRRGGVALVVLVVLVVFAIATGPTAPASAQDPEGRARELFLEGRHEVQQGDVESGCKKLLEAHTLSPNAVGPLLNVADCDERAGRFATAWLRFQRAAELAPAEDHRRAFADKRAAELEARVPHLRLDLSPNAPPGTRVTQDGEVLDDLALATTRPLDPGSYAIEVRAPGHRPRRYEVVLTAGVTQRLALDLGPLESPPAIFPPPPAPAPLPPDPRPGETDGMSGRAIAGWTMGGVGVVAIGIGVVTGILVGVHASTYEDHCTDGICDDEGLDAASAGNTFSVVSPVSFAIGGAAVAVALPLLLTSPEMSSRGPAIGAPTARRGLHLEIGGAF